MGRQPLWRRVGFIPQVTYFKPAGVRLAKSEEICLVIEEAETIRLKDFGELTRSQATTRRSRFGRSTLPSEERSL